MAINKTELWAELDATDEGFVRDKYRRGGYSSAKHRLVGEWLSDREARRAAERAELAALRTARWTMVGTVATAMTFLLGVCLAAAPLLK